ncbi:MAG: hypothetical protein H6730_21970 [Deltaproteobacteria bacterium]|nr:hypothetical protein [Deltaproteobacteria bacterium]
MLAPLGLLALGFATACVPGVPVPLPELPEGWTFLLVQPEGDAHHAIFFDADTESAAVRPGEAWLGAYPFGPESLGLEVGDDLARLEPTEGQALPPPPLAWRADPVGDPWQVITGPEPWSQLRVPVVDVDACADRGGCISEDDPWRCNLDCTVSAPVAPAPPRLECPDGWDAGLAPDGITTLPCLPHLPEAQACGAGLVQGPFDDGCVALYACPAPDDPTPTEPGAVLRYVDPRAGTPGDGSVGAPWRSLLTALEQAPDGATLVLAPGEHAGGGEVVGKALHLVGRCPTETTILGAGETASLACRSGQLRLTGLTVVADQAPGVYLSDCTARVEGVAVEGGVRGIFAIESTLDVEGLRTRTDRGVYTSSSAVQLQRWDHRGGAGLTAEQGTLVLEDALLESSGSLGVVLRSVSTSTLARIRVVGTFDRGVGIERGFGSASFTDLVVQGHQGLRVRAGWSTDADPQPKLRLRRAVFLGTGDGINTIPVEADAEDVVIYSNSDGALRVIQEGPWAGQLDIRRLRVWTNRDRAVLLGGDVEPGFLTPVSGTDWHIEAVGPASTNAVTVYRNIVLSLNRAQLFGGRDYGALVRCGRVLMEDVTIDGGDLAGILIHAQERSTFQRLRLTGVSETKLLVAKKVGDCSPTPVIVEDASFDGCAGCLRGVGVLKPATLVLDRAHVHDYSIGLELEADAGLEVRDSLVDANGTGFILPSAREVPTAVRGVRMANGTNIRLQRP